MLIIAVQLLSAHQSSTDPRAITVYLCSKILERDPERSASFCREHRVSIVRLVHAPGFDFCRRRESSSKSPSLSLPPSLRACLASPPTPSCASRCVEDFVLYRLVGPWAIRLRNTFARKYAAERNTLHFADSACLPWYHQRIHFKSVFKLDLSGCSFEDQIPADWHPRLKDATDTSALWRAFLRVSGASRYPYLVR